MTTPHDVREPLEGNTEGTDRTSDPAQDPNVQYWSESGGARIPVDVQDGRVNFKCLAEKCQTPCCGPFAGLDHGMAPCFVTSFSDLYLLEEDIDRLLAAGRGDLLEHSEHGFRLRLRPDLSCAAFQDGLCSIHTIRPAICRAFPFDFDIFAGLVLISKCPGVNAGWSEPEDFRDAIEALQSVYRRWMVFTSDRVEAVIAPAGEDAPKNDDDRC